MFGGGGVNKRNDLLCSAEVLVKVRAIASFPVTSVNSASSEWTGNGLGPVECYWATRRGLTMTCFGQPKNLQRDEERQFWSLGRGGGAMERSFLWEENPGEGWKWSELEKGRVSSYPGMLLLKGKDLCLWITTPRLPKLAMGTVIPKRGLPGTGKTRPATLHNISLVHQRHHARVHTPHLHLEES